MNHAVGLTISADQAEFPVGRQVPKHKLRVSLVLGVLAGDIAALFLGILTAHLFRYRIAVNAESLIQMAAILPIYFLNTVALRACTGEALISLTESVRRGILVVLSTGGLLVFLLFALKETDEVSRLVIISGFALSTIFISIFRVFYVQFSRRKLEGGLYSVLFLQDGQFPTALGNVPAINVGGIFNPEQHHAEDYHRLAGILSSVDRVVVRCTQERRDVWAHVLQGMNVHAEIVAPEISQTGALAIGNYAGRPTYVVARGPLSLRDRLVKRTFDLIVAGFAIAFLMPFLLLVAALVKLDSQGPVMFRQQRIGRQNRLFSIYKFRSMKVDRCDADGTCSTARDDDRVTRVGRLIRATSIDELPQLINVLTGDMSIVGPRPHAVNSTAQSKLFWEVDRRYWYRHACKPGITGLAQIRGFRGATHNERDLTDRLEADLEYLSRWSFWNDIAIIVRTAAVLIHRNAY